MATTTPIQTTGRRKRAVARVRLVPGDGTMIVNGRTLEDYFPSAVHRQQLSEPFRITETDGSWDVSVTMHGGGPTGQAGAMRLGIARGLLEIDPEYRDLPEKGGLPHTRFPQEGVQEVRPQEGSQGSAVLEALSGVARRRYERHAPVRN